MYITSVYLSTYNENTPISGRMTVKLLLVKSKWLFQLIFAIHYKTTVEAWVLHQRKLADEILAGTPA